VNAMQQDATVQHYKLNIFRGSGVPPARLRHKDPVDYRISVKSVKII
jgi:hypothetical protein